jgi:hypothetical protein
MVDKPADDVRIGFGHGAEEGSICFRSGHRVASYGRFRVEHCDQFIGGFRRVAKPRGSSSIVYTMDMESSLGSRRNGSVSYMPSWTDMPSTQAGLAAALKRAFESMADEDDDKFLELLRKLD